MSQITSYSFGVFPPGGVVETLTGNSGGAVGPDGANNINVVGDGVTIDVAGNPGTNTLTISSLANSVAFSAYLSATQSNVTGDGTTFVVPYDSTYFNNGAAFNVGSGVFIAPQDGEYCFSVNMFLEDIDVAATAGQVDLNVNSGGAIHTITSWNVSTFGDLNGDSMLNGFRILSLNANDTVGVQVTVSNTTLTIDVNGGASTDCVFEGFLVASIGGGTNGFNWNLITVVGPTAMSVQNGYVTNNVAQVGLDLPASSVFGDIIRIAGLGAGGWIINQAAGQSIIVGTDTSTVGVAGSVQATDPNDVVELLCVVANTTWLALGGIGTLTVT